MTLEQDLARLALQEQTLRFEKFDESTAWEIGSRLKSAAEKRSAALIIDITLGQISVFTCALPGSSPNNANWVKRKRATVLNFHRSSYAMGLQLQHDKTDLESKFGLSLRDFAVHGGSFPIRAEGVGGVVGAITVSGLPQREDHKIVVSVVAEFLGKSLDGLQLD
ncbi:MAG: heme-degrading domain-containing protein [Nibricoccus sp.]